MFYVLFTNVLCTTNVFVVHLKPVVIFLYDTVEVKVIAYLVHPTNSLFLLSKHLIKLKFLRVTSKSKRFMHHNILQDFFNRL